MDHIFKVNSKMVKLLVKIIFTSIPMDRIREDQSSMVFYKDKACLFLKLEDLFMKVHGKIINPMEKVNKYIRMARFIRENLWMG